jgi:hypothetical protein
MEREGKSEQRHKGVITMVERGINPGTRKK